MKFLRVKHNTKSRSKRAQQQAGQFSAGNYVSRRPQPTKPPRALYKRGSSRTGATSYGIKKITPESIKDASPREKMRRLQSLHTKMLISRWLLIAASVGLFIVSYNFTAAVHLNVSGGDDIRSLSAKERDNYISTIQEYYKKQPWERINFFLNKDQLSSHISGVYSEVKILKSAGVSGLGEHAFNIEFRKPVASWRMSGEEFFVDDRGLAFKNNLFDSPGVGIVDNSGARSEEGDVLISSSFLRFIGRTISFSSQRGYNVTEVTIPPLAFRQVEISIEGLPYKVLMTTSRDSAVQVEDMDNAIKYFNSQGRVPNYIDVRVEGRAFFRD